MIVKLIVHNGCEIPTYEINGFDISPIETGKIYLDPGMSYDCIVLTERHIQFENGILDVALHTHDLYKLICDGHITVRS